MKIKGIMQRLTGVIAGLTLVSVMLLATTGNAWAEDKVYLKDGRVLEGEIIREVNGSVWITYSIGGVEQKGAFFASGLIDRIERDATGDLPPSESLQAAKASTTKVSPRKPGEHRGVVITLEGMVGMQFSATPLEELIPWLEEQDVDVVVFKIKSGGGYALEVPILHDLLYNEYKPRFRTVAWIETAISAAAMTSHILEEIYFMPEGNYGACTMWSGALQQSDEYSTEKVIMMMEKVSAKANHPEAIMRSMQLGYPLSCNQNQNGDFTWYNSDEGEFLVNPKDRILTFDSEQAARFKFSKGTADNLDELTKLLGYPEVNWLGEHVAGEIFPISKAELEMREWRKGITTAEEKFQTYFVKYNMSIGNAQSAQDITERGMFVGQARRHLAVIKRAVKKFPIFALLRNLTPEWFAEQQEMLRDLMRQP